MEHLVLGHPCDRYGALLKFPGRGKRTASLSKFDIPGRVGRDKRKTSQTQDKHLDPKRRRITIPALSVLRSYFLVIVFHLDKLVYEPRKLLPRKILTVNNKRHTSVGALAIDLIALVRGAKWWRDTRGRGRYPPRDTGGIRTQYPKAPWRRPNLAPFVGRRNAVLPDTDETTADDR